MVGCRVDSPGSGLTTPGAQLSSSSDNQKCLQSSQMSSARQGIQCEVVGCVGGVRLRAQPAGEGEPLHIYSAHLMRTFHVSHCADAHFWVVIHEAPASWSAGNAHLCPDGRVSEPFLLTWVYLWFPLKNASGLLTPRKIITRPLPRRVCFLTTHFLTTVKTKN